MKAVSVLGLMVCVLTLCACDAADQSSPMQAKETVFAPAVDDLNKARAVQDILQEGQTKTNAAIEAAAQADQ